MNIIKYILERLNNSKKDVQEKIETLSILDRVFNNKSDDNDEDLSFIRPNGPCIYAFYTNKVHDAIKVGYTDQHPEKRIEQWKKHYGTGEGEVVCLGYWSAEEIDSNKERVFFWDHAVHEKIRANDFKQLNRDEFMASLTDEGKKLANIKFSREFFSKYKKLLSGELSDKEKTELSPELIQDIIEEMKDNIKNGTADFKLYRFDTKEEADKTWGSPATYNNTQLQKDCIEKGKNAIKEGKKNILMAAVMRFGKTHATYEIIKESPNIKRVIICSAKADVRKAWRDDINHVHFYKDFVFVEVDNKKWDITHYNEKTNKLITEHCNTYDDVDLLAKYKDKTILFFFTLHDLGGSVKSLKSKHKGLFDEEFDLMVVDETHYGSHANLFGKVTGLGVSDDNEDAKEAIELAKEMGKEIANIKRKQILQVSGTPYYILASNELVDKENTAIISDVSYTDMLNARNKWAEDNMDKDPSESPYFGVPTLHKIGLRLTNECSKAIKKSGKTDSLTALFEMKDGKFVHEKPIKHLMQSIFGDGTDEKLAFLKNKKVQGNKVCNHTLIVLPRIEACVALKNVLVEFLHKDRHVYEIVSSNADFKDVAVLNKTLEELDVKGEKSIVLTVNKWLTGVSMPCIDSMIFLKNASSPQDYDQSIFRLCTRRVKTVKPNKDEADGGEKELKRINMKENVYLIDFNIDNMFNMLNNSARMKANVEGNPSIERIKELMEDDLKATPIFCEMSASNEIASKMHKIDRDDLLKVYTGYNSSKSIADIVNDEIDISFNSFFANKSIQSIIGKLQIVGDKSKSGEILNDEGNKEGDDEIENIGGSSGSNSDKSTGSVKDSINDVKDKKDKKLIEEIKRKFKTITKYVLYCNICLDEPCSSFEMFVKQAKEDEHCKQMVKDFGIPLKALEELFDKMDVNSKNKYDCLISNMSILAMDASKDSYEKFSTAIKGLGRIDTSEVITPESVVNKMIDKLSKEDFEKAERILLVNEKQCEFFNGIFKKFGKDVAKKCVIVPSSEIGKQLCIKMLKSMGIDNYIDMILDIQDLTGDNKKDIIDFLEMNNNDILEMNNGKKFDICLMNPPYGSKKSGNGSDLHFKFVEKCLEVSNKQISIFPDRIITSSNTKYNNYKKLFDKTLENVEQIDANKYFNINVGTVGIFTFNIDKKSNNIKITYLNDTSEIVASLNEKKSKFNEYEESFLKYLENDKPIVMAFYPHGKDKTDNLENYLVHYSNKIINNTFKYYLTTNYANGAMNAKFISGKSGFIGTLNELLQNLKENKGSSKNIIGFNDNTSAENCKIALQNPLLRFTCYKLQDDQSMGKRVYKYVPDIDWSDDRVKTDEGLLEVCGCPKDKCKEYADYCKKIIEQVDKK